MTTNPDKTPTATVTPQEREQFLRRRGWRDDLSEQEKKALEDRWTDEDIAMATNLGY